MLLTECRSGGLLKYLHFDSPDILCHPLVADGAEKGAPGFRRHATIAHAAFGVRLLLDQRQEAHVLDSELLEESVYFRGALHIMGIHDTQNLAQDPVLLQELAPTYSLLIAGLLVLSYAEPVMYFPRTVQANPRISD